MADTEFGTVHAIWTGVITVGGLIVAFFTKRLVEQIDAKADECDLNELKVMFRDFMVQQQNQHRDNTSRLDQIMFRLPGNGK